MSSITSMLAASAARIMVSSARREFAIHTEEWFLRNGSRPCALLGSSVCGTSGSRMTLIPMLEISVMVCAMVRPVPEPPLAQNVLPMYCSIGAPLGLVGSSGGSCRPSSPNQEPHRTGNTVPFLVMRPCALTRNCAFVDPTVNGTAVLTVLNDGEPLSKAVAVAVWLPAATPVALKLYGDVVSVPTSVPSMRNSTRTTPPPGSLAVAANGTAAPAANDWLAVGEVRDTVGGVLPPPPTVNVTAGVVVLNAGLPLSTAVAVTL